MSRITIYKASAGSGKTFTLTRQFLTHLFETEENYKHILATTFTNKATEEMKTRIIKELHNLATGKKSDHRDYLLNKLSRFKTEEQINKASQKILADILHNYSHLSITTIDRFFQRIIRAFAREIRVSSNYNIELNEADVLQKATEQLFFDLEKKGNEALLDWMTSFAEEQIETGKSWNFGQSIGKLSDEFLKENYKRLQSENNKNLGNFIFLKNYLDKITGLQKNILTQLKETAKKGIHITEQFNLDPTDFKYGKNSGASFLYKIRQGIFPDKIGVRTLDMLDKQDAWFTKTSPKKDDIIAACNSGLQETLITLVQQWEEHFLLYNSISVIRSNFYSLGILSDLERQVKSYIDDNNLMLLSSSNQLINNIIENSDTPFIYEKTGNRFNHYMLDEFQDTSQLQWNNLKPLISNSLAEGHNNLIVGDVKQSIYRWRNSDWKQLAHGIKNEFGQLVKEEILPVNWRSYGGIIRFNNTLIQQTARHLKERYIAETETQEDNEYAQLFDTSYADVIQEVPPKAEDRGYISMKFFDEEEKDWHQTVLEELPKTIEQAQDNGYKLSDIAILVSKNKIGAEISRFLLNYAATKTNNKYRYDVISNEALWISSSYDVQFLINIFRHIVQPCNLTASQLNILYNNYLNVKSETSFIWQETDLHPFITEQLQHITSLSLLETTEELIRRFNLGNKESEAIFIQAFIDTINDFETMQSGGMNEFLIWWDECGCSKSINTPEDQDAITIQTIHKSKGLEYKIVIIPYLDWDITDNRGYLWASTDTAPLNEIPYLPVRISKQLNNTLFKKEYQEEMLLQYIDTLNLIYVALTRAKECIIGFGNNNKKNICEGLISALKSKSEENNNTLNLSKYWDEDNLTFEYGTFPSSKEKHKTNATTLPLTEYCSNKKNNNLMLHLQSHDFEISDNNLSPTSTKTGKIWHHLFEQITSLNDLPLAVEKLVQEGIVPNNSAQQLLNNVATTLEHPVVKSWFSPKAKVRNEASILTPEGHNYRPDRIIQLDDQYIIVDFKFGNIEKNTYNKQVQRYMNLVKRMGHQNVKGYLWYVGLGKIVSV